ncbi:MAG: Sphingobium phage Lacusarx [Planctomycetota bacterium]|jgi:hypothetical protein
MSTPAATANSILNLIYRAIAWATIADNAGTSPATVLDIALHTAAPATVAQSSNEATYAGYARVQITRNAAGWSEPSGGSLNNASLFQFPIGGTGANQTITHVSVGAGGNIIHFGALAASRQVQEGITPQFGAGALVSTIT